jgi:hypothetical protein
LELLLHSGIYKTDFMHGWIADHLVACNVRIWPWGLQDPV